MPGLLLMPARLLLVASSLLLVAARLLVASWLLLVASWLLLMPSRLLLVAPGLYELLLHLLGDGRVVLGWLLRLMLGLLFLLHGLLLLFLLHL